MVNRKKGGWGRNFGGEEKITQEGCGTEKRLSSKLWGNQKRNANFQKKGKTEYCGRFEWSWGEHL